MTIKDIRKSKKIGQVELARVLNVTQATISLYENGLRQPDISLIPKLAEILQCSIEDIVYCFCN